MSPFVDFAIAPLRSIKQVHIDTYVKIGAVLKTSNEAGKVTQSINEALRVRSRKAKLFFFVEASSGMGKSQLAYAIDKPVIYIPLSLSQYIYECYRDLHFEMDDAIKTDLKMLNEGYNINDFPAESATVLLYKSNCLLKYRTCGLLIELFKMVHGKSNEQSHKILTGYGTKTSQTVSYSALTIQEAASAIAEYGYDDLNKVPCFIVDEAPSRPSGGTIDYSYNTEDFTFGKCIFLRNLIRSMQGVCILSGTNAAAINVIESAPSSSRSDDKVYVRLIVKLPPTHWEVFEERASQLQLSAEFIGILKKTRPMFVDWTLSALEEEYGSTNNKRVRSSCSSSSCTGKREVTVSLLDKVHAYILRRKVLFGSDEGLYAQLALMFPSIFNGTVTDKACCIRHHFGITILPAKYKDNVILPLYVSNNCNIGVLSTEDAFMYKPTIGFATPDVDPYLYMVCFRNGLYYHHRAITSSNAWLNNIKRNLAVPLCNPNQLTCSGLYQEREMISAAIMASHSYSKVNGCPLKDFLGTFISEFNIVDNKPMTMPSVIGMPGKYNEYIFGLLSPCNKFWDLTTPNRVHTLAGCLLNDVEWSSNSDLMDAHAIISKMEGNQLVNKQLAFESKCKEHVPIADINHTMGNSNKKAQDVTIMVVTHLSEGAGLLSSDFANYGDDYTRVKIVGNANQKIKVATELNWTEFSDINTESNNNAVSNTTTAATNTTANNNNNTTATSTTTESPKKLLIVIILESIYYGRYDSMKDIYRTP